MKRSNLFIILIVVLALLCSVTFMACHHDVPGEPTDTTTDPTTDPTTDNPPVGDTLAEGDFYAEANKTHTYSYTYRIKSGETVVYTDTNGAVQNPYNLDVPKASFTSGGNGLNYEGSAFSNTNIQVQEAMNMATLEATIANPATFLGVESATNATVKIIMYKSTKELRKVSISYDVTSKGINYSVTVDLSVE